ncbi:unnamed protein product [Dovyalis caffra]|uniref:Geminivirus AL1 replication-associated protein central domain-containing protein n=1 Tax=Dovyalis caffra TaxID=77055 RepID=A0AAV1RPX2_9ROSI|nr:unnamed protein product [Dovyalis caffra]
MPSLTDDAIAIIRVGDPKYFILQHHNIQLNPERIFRTLDELYESSFSVNSFSIPDELEEWACVDVVHSVALSLLLPIPFYQNHMILVGPLSILLPIFFIKPYGINRAIIDSSINIPVYRWTVHWKFGRDFDQKFYGTCLHVIRRCNNVLYLRGVPEDEEIEDADRD